ncbi:MAG: bifunctional folylpolyglutamate synthase/dihydrofolate synthase [Lachnospiraceae bacterium]|nr:bifunctional folylpolyglutamate synthase/dihydrofolate synthase [Lachnospiraceae bacterium]
MSLSGKKVPPGSDISARTLQSLQSTDLFSLNDSHNGDETFSYLECEQYILKIPRFTTEKHSLTDLRRFLSGLGDPHRGKKIIHVAGTNGKGSVCAYLQAIFSASGISAGLFTSPHLSSMRERIKINGCICTEEEFVAAFLTVKEKITDFHPTFFEFLFLMAMVIFDKTDIECLILETGLGGRLDATNVIEDKDLTIITPISYDHMEYLGTTLKEIAGEKAGIMRPGTPLVTSGQEAEVIDLLRDRAAEYDSPIAEINSNAIKINKIASKTIDFSYQYRYDIIVRIMLTTKALYQIENASLAIHSALIFNDERISIDSIKLGLGQTVWPGRMEEIETGIVIDGAHNEAGISAFVTSVKAIPCTGRKFLLFGGVREKRSREMITSLKKDGVFTEIITCPLNNPRSLTPEDFLALFPPGQIFTNVESGLAYLLKKKQAGDLIFITGSLYLYDEIKTLLIR